MTTVLAILIGCGAFLTALLFDWISLKRFTQIKPFVTALSLGLHAWALYLGLWHVSRFELPLALTILAWIILLASVLLLVYSLMIELPARKTYFEPGISGQLIKTGTYALVRHPVVLWYVIAIIALILASHSTVLAVAAPLWITCRLITVTIQDKLIFIKMFPEYPKYQQETPMLIPNCKSIRVCLNTLRWNNRLTTKTGVK
jgi:protein-S-isoprenylcysteine O-methyltransferase Ste14